MERLKIAIQKKGRLNEKTMALLRNVGLGLTNGVSQLKVTAKDFPAEVLFLRDDDIPQYVQDGVADIGIVGENEYLEKQRNALVVERLGFARCRLSLAVPKTAEYSDISWFNGKKIATSYPEITRDYLTKQGVSAQIENIGGSVEIAPGIGLADGICDLVSSGSTLFTNGLKEVVTVLRSEAVLIANATLNPTKKALLDQLVFRIQTVQKSERYKYVLMNVPNSAIAQVIQLLPGMKSPTVMPLAQKGWSSLHSVIEERDFWQNIEALKRAGAEGLLIVPIQKMVN